MSETLSNAGSMRVGVVLPIGEGQTGVPSYAEVRDYALRAEALGFDSLWIVDHLLARFPERPPLGIWECWSMLAAIAEATERISLGTLVVCTAFRNPAILAKMANDVDAISGGRLILGLGAGWHQPEFAAFGLPFDHLASRFDEAMQIIVPLLREGKVDFRGAYYRAENCELRPRGPRPNGPPIMVGAGRPRMLGITARDADMWNTCWLGQPTLLAERRAAIEAACSAAGRDPATLAVTVGVSVAAPGHLRPADDPTKVLSGTPDEIAAGLRAYQDLGVSDVICMIDPPTPAALEWLAGALVQLRAGA